MPLLVFALTALLAKAPAEPAGVREEIAVFQRELVAALKNADRAALERLLTTGFTFVHSTGGVDDKQTYIDNIVTSARQGRGTDIERLDERIEVYENRTAVATVRGIVRRGGMETPLRSTHVYVKLDGRWQWAGGQSTRLPMRPAAGATLSAELRKAYTGSYAVSPGRVLTIREDGEVLRASLPGFREAELIPRTETELAWFNPDLNVESQLVMIRDDDGAVTHAAYRRDGREVWRARRVPAAP
jgi:hypothetical protein